MVWMFPLLQSHLPLPSDPYGVLDIYLLSKNRWFIMLLPKKASCLLCPIGDSNSSLDLYWSCMSNYYIDTLTNANEPALDNCCKFAVGIGGLELTRLLA